MRYLIHTLLGLLLMTGLAACGGNTVGNPPTLTPDTRNIATLEPNELNLNPFATEAPPESEFPDNSENIAGTLIAFGAPIQPTTEATQALFGGINVAPEEQLKPGVIDYAEATEDPDVGAVFDQVSLIRGGGVNTELLQIDIFQDGTLMLSGETVGNIGPNAVAELDQILDELNFFGIRGSFAAAVPNYDIYQYNITVSRGGTSLTLNADDVLIPPELQALAQHIIGLAFGVQSPPARATAAPAQ